MIEILIVMAAMVLNGCYNYWIYRRICDLGVVNRHQMVTIRRLAVNATEASGKIVLLIDELKVREEAARGQREGFNRALLKIVKDTLPNLPENRNGNGNRKAAGKMQNQQNPAQENIVLHERHGF